MYECTYEHTYHYLLSKVIFKYERKLVGTSVRVFVSTYVCMYMDDCVRYIVRVPYCRFRILPKSFPFAFQFKKIAYSTILL